MTTLDAQLLKHQLLCFLGERGLVQQASRKVLGISFHEEVSAVEAAEESDDCVKPGINGGIIVDTLKTLGELIVAVEGNEGGRHGLLIHEILEGHITVLLELDVILEALLYQSVHLGLESKELGGELDWVLNKCLVHDDLLSATLDVGPHLLHDEFERGLLSAEDLVH